MQSVTWNDIDGNTSKSYLEQGTDYLTEANLNMLEKLGGDYHFEGQWFLRKTDDRRIEPRRDVRLKQVDLRVSNDENLYQFGDFYADFSQFVLGSSLEGFNIDLRPEKNQHYQFVTARKSKADIAADLFQRNVFGFKADRYFLQDSEIFSNLRFGFQAASSQDDSSTLPAPNSTKDLRNTVIGFDGEVAFQRGPAVQYEYARSMYLEHEDSATGHDTDFGSAFRIQPSWNLGKTNLRYLYYYGQPGFYSDAGSSMADKIQHQLSIDHRFSDRLSVTVSENYYWDHLTGSTLTKRTYNNEKYLNLNIVPFAWRTSLFLRPYVNYLAKDSDDEINSVESRTVTTGINMNDRLNEHTTCGLGYEYRSFTDQAAKTSSETFHRIKGDIAQDFIFLKRRLYYSFGPIVDIRNRKGDDDKDVHTSIDWNLQYDLTPGTTMRMGHTIADTNSATPDGDYLNNRGFWEFDFLINKERSAHFVLRSERNHYINGNGAQSYKELRVISKLVVNF